LHNVIAKPFLEFLIAPVTTPENTLPHPGPFHAHVDECLFMPWMEALVHRCKQFLLDGIRIRELTVWLRSQLYLMNTRSLTSFPYPFQHRFDKGHGAKGDKEYFLRLKQSQDLVRQFRVLIVPA